MNNAPEDLSFPMNIDRVSSWKPFLEPDLLLTMSQHRSTLHSLLKTLAILLQAPLPKHTVVYNNNNNKLIPRKTIFATFK